MRMKEPSKTLSEARRTRARAGAYAGDGVLAGQTALVTGAGGGIGRALAAHLAAAGVSLCLTDLLPEVLSDAAASLAPDQVALRYPADLTDENQVRGLGAFVEQRWGELDVLIHCAGYLATGPVGVMPIEELDRHYRVNFRAPYLLTQLLLPLLRQRSGQVVFLNSSVVFHPREGVSQYAAMKQALRGFADSLRSEVNPYGIRVLTVFPGRTASGMQKRLHAVEGRPYHPEQLSQPEDVAATIVAALTMPRTTEVLEILLRPTSKGV
jgi:NAD(P)-dependent dehydrogenase (short-subunit alcohol dehydrogenase family)